MVKKVTNANYLVIQPLLYGEEWKHLAELSRAVGMPHVTARLYLAKLEEEGIVIKSKKGRLTLYKLNYANPLILDSIVLVEKEKLLQKCKHSLLLKEIVGFLHTLGSKEIIIFGSAVEDIKNARDIDLILTGNMKKKTLLEAEKKIGIKFHLIRVNSLDNITFALKEEIKKKHLIISNTEGVVKWMLKN